MISVIVPTYNEEANIAPCLESLCHQTLPRERYEIIVVDGGSTDRTREIAEQYADLVFVQTSKKVGGARNDGAKAAQGEILATTDADCVIPPDWLARIDADFTGHPDAVQVFGLLNPKVAGGKCTLSLFLINNFARFGALTHLIYYTLGCNTAFRRDAFMQAGMYRCIDAGDDLEIACRMRKAGRVLLDQKLRVAFDMRRYEQYGTLRSLWEWWAIVLQGGNSKKYHYSKREYK